LAWAAALRSTSAYSALPGSVAVSPAQPPA